MGETMKKPSRLRAWVIAASCSWINFFLFTVFRSAGVLYLAMVTSWGCTYEEASWPMTLASGVAAMTCLPVGFLSHYLPLRMLVMSGICITSFSISICFFASSIYFINVFVGIFHGIGIGFVTGLLPVIISEYFGRRRTAATGLSYAGAGFGAFIFPLVFQSLLDSCGLQKSLLIMGGLIFNCTFGAILLIPPSSSYDMLPLCLSKRKEVTSNEAEIEGDCRTTLRQSSSPSPHSTQSLTASDETASGTGYTDDSTVGVVEDRHHQNDTNRKCRECRNDTGRFFHPIKHERSLGRKDDRREFALLNERSSLETSREEVVFSQHHEEQWNHHEEEQWIQGAKGEQKETGDEEKVPQNERRNQLQYSSPLPRHQDGKKEAKAVISMTSEAGEESRSKEIHELKEEVLPPRKLSSKIDTTHQGEHLKTKDSLLNRIHSQILTDAKILTHRHFFLINTTYVSYLMANVTFLMILPDFAVDAAKVSKSQGVLLISFFALSDIFGRLLPGWLPVSNKNLYAFSILSMGSLLLSCPLFLSLGTDLSTKYDTLILIAICCGFVSGCQMVLPPVVIADLMGRENTAVAFGLCNFVYGLCNFGRPFLFRQIKDEGNMKGDKYNTIFFLCGGVALMSGLLWIVESVVTGVVHRTKRKSLPRETKSLVSCSSPIQGGESKSF